MKKAISTNGAPAAIGPYSQAIDCGEFVFTSGQLGLDPATGKLADGGVQAQATQAMKNIQAVLTAAGLWITWSKPPFSSRISLISPPLTRSTPLSLRELPTPHAAPIR